MVPSRVLWDNSSSRRRQAWSGPSCKAWVYYPQSLRTGIQDGGCYINLSPARPSWTHIWAHGMVWSINHNRMFFGWNYNMMSINTCVTVTSWSFSILCLDITHADLPPELPTALFIRLFGLLTIAALFHFYFLTFWLLFPHRTLPKEYI